MNNALLNGAQKFNYSEELVSLLERIGNLYIEEFGEEILPQLNDVLENVKIVCITDLNQEKINKTQEQEFGNLNPHVVEEQTDIYGSNSLVGACYSYIPVYDNEMNVIDEKRIIFANDGKGSYNEQDFKELFNTSLNVPYLIHEIGHAIAMTKPVYRTQGNQIYVKHGMYESIEQISKEDGKFKLSQTNKRGLLLEEAINEFHTRNIVTKFLNVKDYNEARQILNNHHYVPASYNDTMLVSANHLVSFIPDKLKSYRFNNDTSFIDDFNNGCLESEFAELLDDKLPYDYMDSILTEMFNLVCKKGKISLEEYTERMRKFTGLSIMTIVGYREVNDLITEETLSNYKEHMEKLGIEIHKKRV